MAAQHVLSTTVRNRKWARTTGHQRSASRCRISSPPEATSAASHHFRLSYLALATLWPPSTCSHLVPCRDRLMLAYSTSIGRIYQQVLKRQTFWNERFSFFQTISERKTGDSCRPGTINSLRALFFFLSSKFCVRFPSFFCSYFLSLGREGAV